MVNAMRCLMLIGKANFLIKDYMKCLLHICVVDLTKTFLRDLQQKMKWYDNFKEVSIIVV